MLFGFVISWKEKQKKKKKDVASGSLTPLLEAPLRERKTVLLGSEIKNVDVLPH